MGANALFVLPASGDIKFSQVRDMYDQGNGTSLGFKKYYRDGTIVTDTTYHDDTVNPFGNTAHDIPASDELRMSQFRGAFKEHRVPVGDVAAPYNIDSTTVDTAEKRTYRFYVTGHVHQSASAWDSSGNGKSGMEVVVMLGRVVLVVLLVRGHHRMVSPVVIPIVMFQVMVMTVVLVLGVNAVDTV